jgi:hypothetical protein
MAGRGKDMQYLKAYSGWEIRIHLGEILRFMAEKRAERELPSSFKNLVKQQVVRAHSLLRPRALYSCGLKVPWQQHQMFKDAERMILGLCTIGSDLEIQVGQHFREKEYLEGMVLDAIGTVAVESLVALVEGEIESLVAKQGFSLSARLGPGYGDWPLEEQHLLFSQLPHEELGVKINSGGMMTPRKSISFAYRMGRENMVKPVHGDSCQLCNLGDRCAYKKNHQVIRILQGNRTG